MENGKVIAELLQRIKTLESRCDRYENGQNYLKNNSVKPVKMCKR